MILTQGIISKFRYAGLMISSYTGLATKDKTKMTTKNKYDDFVKLFTNFFGKKILKVQTPESTKS